MPVYDYRCLSCQSIYDVYHKTREVSADIVCPSCGSRDAKKLMSVPASLTSVQAASTSSESCENPGGCCGGSCGLN